MSSMPVTKSWSRSSTMSMMFCKPPAEEGSCKNDIARADDLYPKASARGTTLFSLPTTCTRAPSGRAALRSAIASSHSRLPLCRSSWSRLNLETLSSQSAFSASSVLCSDLMLLSEEAMSVLVVSRSETRVASSPVRSPTVAAPSAISSDFWSVRSRQKQPNFSYKVASSFPSFSILAWSPAIMLITCSTGVKDKTEAKWPATNSCMAQKAFGRTSSKAPQLLSVRTAVRWS
mmetsp:Transcript_53808/g.115434  ORF Transcript_53808/g.115434 Transcript_53808/m.115434 type:complete len:232 (-) Transcript_53808:9-704(-)